MEDGKKNIFFIGDCGRLKYNFPTICFFSMRVICSGSLSCELLLHHLGRVYVPPLLTLGWILGYSLADGL